MDWPTIEHDPGRTGTAPAEAQIGTANADSLTQNWSATLDGKVSAQPLFLSGVQVMGATHDVVIAATNQNTLYALDANTGTVLWSDHLAAAPASCGIPGGFGISAAPVVDRSTGRIFAVTDDGNLRTVSLANGSEVAPALPLVPNPATNYVWGRPEPHRRQSLHCVRQQRLRSAPISGRYLPGQCQRALSPAGQPLAHRPQPAS